MIRIEVTLTFETPPNIGSGAQVGTFAERACIKGLDGWPYIPASAFKGRLRHAVEQVAAGMGQAVCTTHHSMCRKAESACPACRIFGSPWLPGRLRFVDLELSGPPELVEQRRRGKRLHTSARHSVALSRARRVAEDGLLFATELLVPGVPLEFSGTLEGPLDLQEAAWVIAGLRFLPALGRAKSSGLGWVKAEGVVYRDGERVGEEALRAALLEVHR
ncbi:MAG TPA: hypothetical protein G4O00_06165 [Thermoflexia bacterium]|nr:hypothetical protein [Thermoflexia bacterium]